MKCVWKVPWDIQINLFIDREAGEILRVVASIRLSGFVRATFEYVVADHIGLWPMDVHYPTYYLHCIVVDKSRINSNVPRGFP